MQLNIYMVSLEIR